MEPRVQETQAIRVFLNDDSPYFMTAVLEDLSPEKGLVPVIHAYLTVVPRSDRIDLVVNKMELVSDRWADDPIINKMRNALRSKIKKELKHHQLFIDW